MNETRINKNATYNIIKNIFAIVFPLITFPYISRVLGAENTGKINFGNSIVSYFGLVASLGVTTYAIRECATIKNDRKKLSEVSSQIFSINILSTIIAYTALMITLVVASPLESYRFLITVQSTTIICGTLGADWLNTAMSDFRYIAIRTIMFQLLSLVLMFLFVRNRNDYMIYVYISVIALSGSNILNIYYRRRFCSVKFTKNMRVKHHIKPILVLFSMHLAQTIFVSTDTTILGIARGDFEVGLYGASTKIYNMVNTTVASIAWVVMPEMSIFFVERDYEKINGLLKYTANIILVLGLPCLIGINLLAEEIILTMAGNEYLGAVSSLRVLTISLAFSFAGGFIGNIILLPSKRENIMLVGSIISAIVNLILNLILIPILGLNAAAVTTVIANAVCFAFGIPFVDKEIKIMEKRKMLKAPVLGVIGMSVVVVAIKMLYLNAILTMLLGIGCGSIAYFVVLLLLKDEFTVQYVRQVTEKIGGARSWRK